MTTIMPILAGSGISATAATPFAWSRSMTADAHGRRS